MNLKFLKPYTGQSPMASFHKVIKLLKFKSAANLHCLQWKAQIERAHSVAKSHSVRSLNGDHIKINRFGNLQIGYCSSSVKRVLAIIMPTEYSVSVIKMMKFLVQHKLFS